MQRLLKTMLNKEAKNHFILDDDNDAVKPDFPTNNFSQNLRNGRSTVQEKIEEIQIF